MVTVISVNFGAQRVAELWSSVLETGTCFPFIFQSVP